MAKYFQKARRRYLIREGHRIWTLYFTVEGWQWDELYENTLDGSSPHPRPEGTNIDRFSSGGLKPNRVRIRLGLR